jgi:cobalt-zinc-cadmium resistance protein CzcA
MKALLTKWLEFIDHRFILYLTVIVATLGYGGYVAVTSEVEAFPDVTNVQVQVITQYPGKAAEEVERQVTIPIEMVTNGLPGLINRRSISMFGLSVITLTFDDDVQSTKARLDVNMRLSDVDLPESAQVGLSPDSTPVGEIYRYVIEGNQTIDELRLIQDWTVMRELKGIQGVADVVVFGGKRRSIDVSVDLEKLKEYNLDIGDVANELKENNLNAGGGLIERGEQGFLVRSIGLFESPQTLENAVIATRDQIPVRVNDIGQVQFGSRPRLGKVGLNNNEDVVEGIVLLRKGMDTIGTCERIKARVNYLNDNVLPKGVRIRQISDRTELIEKSSHTVYHNIFFGVFLVSTLLILGFGFHYWRLVVAVLMVIPFALFTAFVGVKISGYKPNLISLGAVDFGIIVETAIFCAEAVIAGFATSLALGEKEGEEKKRSIITSLSDVMGPALLCAFLLVIAFIPILTLSRVEGRIFRPLGITLISALIGGQIGAILFVPFAARRSPMVSHADSWQENLFHKFFLKLQHFSRHLEKVKNLKIVGLAVIFGVIGILYSWMGKEFLPALNEGSIYIRIIAPSTVSGRASTQLANEIRARVKTLPEVRDVISQIGRPDDGTDVNGVDTIETFVTLKSPEEWKSADTLSGLVEILGKKLEDLKGVEVSFSQPIKDNVDEAISGVKGELVIKIFGPESAVLQRLAREMEAIVKKAPGAADVAVERLFGQPELRFQMDHDRLGAYGLTVADAASTLESSLVGKVASKMMDPAGRFIDIVVRPILPEKVTTNNLENLNVRTGIGPKVYLKDVTANKLTEGIVKIYREEGERRVAVKISVRGRAVVDFVRAVDHEIRAKVKLPPYYRMVWAGAFENANRASRQLSIVVPICLAFIIVVLQSWFSSWKMVGLVLMEIPFGIIGSLIGLTLFGLNFSISAAAGVVVLIGLSLLTGMMYLSDWRQTNDAWLSLKKKGLSILLSNGVAIIGLIPAAFSNGIGAETAKPFAVAILMGLISSLLLTLLLMPRILEKEKAP